MNLLTCLPGAPGYLSGRSHVICFRFQPHDSLLSNFAEKCSFASKLIGHSWPFKVIIFQSVSIRLELRAEEIWVDACWAGCRDDDICIAGLTTSGLGQVTLLLWWDRLGWVWIMMGWVLKHGPMWHVWLMGPWCQLFPGSRFVALSKRPAGYRQPEVATGNRKWMIFFMSETFWWYYDSETKVPPFGPEALIWYLFLDWF